MIKRWIGRARGVGMWLLPALLLTVLIYKKTGNTGAASVALSAAAALVVVAAARLFWQLPTAYAFSVALVLSIFSGNWQAMGLPGFPYVPDRILLMGGVFLLVVREGAQLRRMRVSAAHALLLLTVLYGAVSAAAAGSLGHQLGLFSFLDQLGAIPFLLFFIAPFVFRTAKDRRVLLFALVVLGLYLGLEAIVEFAKFHSLVFPRYIVSSGVQVANGRVQGPFASAVTEGFGLFGCATAAWVALTVRPPRLIRILAPVVIVLCLVGCLLTLERGVWIGTVASMLVVGLLTRELRPAVLPVAVVAAIAVIGAFAFIPGLEHRVSARSQSLESVYDRENQDAAAYRMIQAKPLFGFGWDTFAHDSLPYFRQAHSYPMSGTNLQLHDVYLSNAVELGLVGFSLWILAQVAALGSVLIARGRPQARAWKIGLAGLIVFNLTVALFNPLQQTFAELLLWTWAGATVAAAGGLPARVRAPAPRGVTRERPSPVPVYDTSSRTPAIT